MILLYTAASGVVGFSSLFLSTYFTQVDLIPNELDDRPYKKTAYKIVILCLDLVFLSIGYINMFAFGLCIASMITKEALLPVVSLFVQRAIVSGALGLGVFVIGNRMHYPRLWKIL